jgi:ATP-dependent Clp protease ATP-binding subunit ClpA
MAEEGKLDPVVGRERNRTCLFWAEKNNPLIGEPGLENPLLEGLAADHTKKVSNPV